MFDTSRNESGRHRSRGRTRRISTSVFAGVLAVAAISCSSDDDRTDATGVATSEADDAPDEIATSDPEPTATDHTAVDEPATTEPVDASITQPTTTVASIGVAAVSTRAEFVTGGDVLIEVELPAGSSADAPSVLVDDTETDVELLAVESESGVLRGLVGGLPGGDATITVETDDARGELIVTNHPITGPVFSGPHQEPFACTTVEMGLGEPTDDDCSAPTVTEEKATPDGRAYTLERGVIDRSIYSLARPDDDWNGRLVYRFGGGCGTSYSQGSDFTGVETPELLDAGYAVVTSTLNTFQTACNDVLSAEVAMMVKEHVSETYGVPEFTIGDGGSGGAIQQLLIAQNYPGLLDGIAPSVPFPDAVSISAGVTDCGLLLNYYATPDGATLTADQRVAINGHRTEGTCALWSSTFLPGIDPTVGCSAALPPEEIYDPVANTAGARCTMQDSLVNLVGQDPETGFAHRPLDNTGVAYGLQALADGVITAEQFVTLNEQVGGYDVDGGFVPERETAPDEVFERMYATGRIITGQSALQDVPIILTNVYTDADGDIHDRQRVFAIRDRLTVEGVADPNVVIWTVPPDGDLLASLTGSGDQANAILALDAWLTAATADTGDGSWPEKLAEHRPAEAVDTCILPDGTEVTGDDIYDPGTPCDEAYPVASDPRRVAGASLANDVIACSKQPVADLVGPGPHGGTVALTDAEIARLEVVFPDGVCDWTVPGVGQAPLDETWLTY